jgi:uncharacterized damage-inducible protein DinB
VRSAAGRGYGRPVRTDTPEVFDDRGVLVAMLDYARATVRHTCDGLDDALAEVAPLSTSPLMTVKGLVGHLRWVEHSWLEHTFLGGPDLGPWTDEEPDAEFAVALGSPLSVLLEEYEAQSARFRDLVARADLDQPSALPISDGRRPTLRWVLQHLIEETARHNGHLDILRELLDGRTRS